MTYIEKKYNITFPFTENCPVLHEQDFGCCSWWKICTKESFCIIPEKMGDGKKHCAISKREGFNKLGAIKKITKTGNFKIYDSSKGVK